MAEPTPVVSVTSKCLIDYVQEILDDLEHGHISVVKLKLTRLRQAYINTKRMEAASEAEPSHKKDPSNG